MNWVFGQYRKLVCQNIKNLVMNSLFIDAMSSQTAWGEILLFGKFVYFEAISLYKKYLEIKFKKLDIWKHGHGLKETYILILLENLLRETAK